MEAYKVKQIFENWRKFLDEAVKPFARGDMHRHFTQQNPSAAISAFERMGADEKVLSTISKYAQDSSLDMDLNQIVAVLAGEKPMYYGPIKTLTSWTEMDQDCYNSLPRTSAPTPVLQEQQCPDIEIGKFIIKNAKRVGITIKPILQNMFVMGKAENVQAISNEANRVGSLKNADAQFHRVMGRSLGYPEKDIEAFVTQLKMDNVI